nr:hypothetical protein [Tanacetum cinerariifolium]
MMVLEGVKCHKGRRLEATVDVSKESGSEPTRKQTSSKRVIKKKFTISADDKIIPEPEVALELEKYISLTEAAEEEAATQVHATYARIVTESVPEPARRKPSEQLAADTMQALKEITPKTLSKRTGAKPGVPDEEKATYEFKADAILKWGSEEESEYTKEDDDENNKWVDIDEEEEKNDDDDDKSLDLKKTNNKETDDEFVQRMVMKILIITDAAKANAKKADEVKDGVKKAELPLTSSSLSISLGFDATYPVFIRTFCTGFEISEPSVLTPIPETPLVAPSITLLPHPSVFTISHVLLQSTTPIPTPLITTKASSITRILDPLHDVIQRVYVLEKDVQELKEAENTKTPRASFKSKIPLAINAFLGSSLGDSLYKVLKTYERTDTGAVSDFATPVIQSSIKKALEKTPLPVAQSSSQAQSSLKAAESLFEYKLKTILFEKMNKSRSYLTHDKNQDLFDALFNSLRLDDAISRGEADA